MSFLSDASLVMIPSGYKDQKVYSSTPTDGSADLTFSRASNATRVNSSGLVEKVRTNEVFYSEDLTNAAWTNFSVTVSANAGTAPDGTTTADKIIPTTTNTNHLIHTNVITSVGEYSFSVYVKAAGYSKVGMRESQSVGFYASFDLTSGTILDSSTDQNNTITSVGDGWFRITSTRSYSGGINLGLIPLENSYTSGQPLSAYAGDGVSGILAWGAQMEYGVATDYIGPTAGTSVSVGPVSGLPRLDYSGGASCPSLLLEPQRTNLALYSEQFNNAVWTKTASTTITANANVSPSGYQDADTYTTTASGTGSQIYRVISVSGTTQTLSIFIKYLSGSGTNLRFSIGSVESLGVNLTFSNSGATLTGVKGSSVNTLNIENYGNNWFRVSISVAYASATAEFNLFRPTGTGTDAYAIWGAQLETSTAYATSYIPTLGTSVTRVWDDASKTGITSLIGQTAGTLFVELNADGRSNATARVIAYLTENGSTDNRVAIQYNASGQIQAIASSGGSTQGSVAYTITGPCKAAFAYNSSGYELFVNGVSRGTFTGSLPTSLTRLDMNSLTGTFDELGGTINQVLIFKTRLSNSDLATLTTL